jgi:hypothetical protein
LPAAVIARSAAVIAASEIKQNAADGSQERTDYPVYYDPNTLGDGNQAESSAKTNAYVEFAKALPTSQTGAVCKGPKPNKKQTRLKRQLNQVCVLKKAGFNVAGACHYLASISSARRSISAATMRAR